MSRPDPELSMHETIVNVTVTAQSYLNSNNIDPDIYNGFTGFTDFVLSTAKSYERELYGKDEEHNHDYWESVDFYTERALEDMLSGHPTLESQLTKAALNKHSDKDMSEISDELQERSIASECYIQRLDK